MVIPFTYITSRFSLNFWKRRYWQAFEIPNCSSALDPLFFFKKTLDFSQIIVYSPFHMSSKNKIVLTSRVRGTFRSLNLYIQDPGSFLRDLWVCPSEEFLFDENANLMWLSISLSDRSGGNSSSLPGGRPLLLTAQPFSFLLCESMSLSWQRNTPTTARQCSFSREYWL